MDQYWNEVVKFRSSTLGSCSRKCLIIFSLILVYLVVMDTAMFFVLQHTDTIVYSGAVAYFSPFTTISVKQLANDPISHFILQPLAEWFEDFTNFATTFTIITPNALSITHALLAIVNFRLISSDHLLIRRCGVVLFEFVVLLDAFDGTVYRSLNKTKYHFIQKRGERGYQIDLVCDTIATACLLLSIMYSQLKHRSNLFNVDIIPVVKPANNGCKKNSRKAVLLTVFAFSGLIILSAVCWDRVVVNMGAALQTKQTDSNLQVSDILPIFYLLK